LNKGRDVTRRDWDRYIRGKRRCISQISLTKTKIEKRIEFLEALIEGKFDMIYRYRFQSSNGNDAPFPYLICGVIWICPTTNLKQI